ncbi:RNA polymerase sigma factor [Evansella sp. AB-P1]|uniref:RNA polymerase sigma factor n=1 Tax=Evansella sp. AB-P1 TaxID=3037653 RepID=UPI00241E40BC|nr:RNA polymerase sigma factor [Evansella sp. AB-P1]MDG5787388.1 RNA polymerase sigma factor [Evansella sp. AB-P1]
MEKNKIITEWFRLYSDDVYRYFLFQTNWKNAEDLVQEVFIKALHSYDVFKEDASPKTWLLRIARNIAIDEHRKTKRKKQLLTIPFDSKFEPKIHSTPDEILQLNEEKKELYEGILSLKPKYRDVLILRGVQELSVKETADVLKWKEDRVHLTYHRAKKKLKENLGGELHE